MGDFQIPFYYTILNGELLPIEKIVYINADEVKILGRYEQQIFRPAIRRFLLKKVALFIEFRGSQYGSQSLTVDELVAQLRICCIDKPDLEDRLHSIEHDIEFE